MYFLRWNIFLLLFAGPGLDSLCAQELDVFNPDYDGLNSGIIEKINNRRLAQQQQALEHSLSLQKTALYLTRDLRLTRFERMQNNRKVLERTAYLKSWKYGNSYTLMTVVIATHYAVNFRGGRFYYDRKDTETRSHLFYGDKPSKKEKEAPGYKADPVEDFSVNELADRIAGKFLRDKRAMKCLNAGYTVMGCSCTLEKNTVGRRRVPVIKATFILGGKRLGLLEEA